MVCTVWVLVPTCMSGWVPGVLGPSSSHPETVDSKRRDVIYNLEGEEPSEGSEPCRARTRICKFSRSLVQHRLRCCQVPAPTAACEAACARRPPRVPPLRCRIPPTTHPRAPARDAGAGGEVAVMPNGARQ